MSRRRPPSALFVPKVADDSPPCGQSVACAHPECDNEGLYPAPRSRDYLHEYQYYCLDHIREINARWNYFEDFTPEEIEAYRWRALLGDRPTQPMVAPMVFEQRLRDLVREFAGIYEDIGAAFAKGEARARKRKAQQDHDDAFAQEGQPIDPRAEIRRKIRAALQALDLPEDAEWPQIKSRFRQLAKELHPDRNPDDSAAAERFRLVVMSYRIIEEIRRKGEGDG